MYENPCEVPQLLDFDKFGYNFFGRLSAFARPDTCRAPVIRSR
ncbi:hypothetical protein X737_15495 [Mesorhizobium sp. L48C026A00]|nr:hypothetical protein X737_15495 [Mesorhizobium sp. L48C026A00]